MQGGTALGQATQDHVGLGKECCLLYTCWEAIGGWTSGASMIWPCFISYHPGCCVHGDYGFAGRSWSISPIQSLSLSAEKKKGDGTTRVWEAIFVHHGNPTQCSRDPNGKEIKRREDICLHTADTPGSPGGSVVKKPTCQYGRWGFNSRARKILWSRKWQSPPGFLPGEAHGQKTGSTGSKRGGRDLVTKQSSLKAD